MATLRHPFTGATLFALANAITKGKYVPLSSESSSEKLRKFLSNLLQVDAKKRPSIQSVLASIETPTSVKVEVNDSRTAIPVVIDAARRSALRRLEAQMKRKKLALENLRAAAALRTKERPDDQALIAKLDLELQQILDTFHNNNPSTAAIIVKPEPQPLLAKSKGCDEPRLEKKEAVTEKNPAFLQSDRDPQKIAQRSRADTEQRRKDIIYGPPAGRPSTARFRRSVEDPPKNKREPIRRPGTAIASRPSWWPKEELPKDDRGAHRGGRRRRPAPVSEDYPPFLRQ